MTTFIPLRYPRFNRRYGEVAAHGDGVYFARDAEYSCHPRYATPDGTGCQRLIYARVLLGHSARGRRGMRNPPQRDELNNFDSLVNRESDPSIFVSGHHDAQVRDDKSLLANILKV